MYQIEGSLSPSFFNRRWIVWSLLNAVIAGVVLMYVVPVLIVSAAAAFPLEDATGSPTAWAWHATAWISLLISCTYGVVVGIAQYLAVKPALQPATRRYRVLVWVLMCISLSATMMPQILRYTVYDHVDSLYLTMGNGKLSGFRSWGMPSLRFPEQWGRLPCPCTFQYTVLGKAYSEWHWIKAYILGIGAGIGVVTELMRGIVQGRAIPNRHLRWRWIGSTVSSGLLTPTIPLLLFGYLIVSPYGGPFRTTGYAYIDEWGLRSSVETIRFNPIVHSVGTMAIGILVTGGMHLLWGYSGIRQQKRPSGSL